MSVPAGLSVSEGFAASSSSAGAPSPAAAGSSGKSSSAGGPATSTVSGGAVSGTGAWPPICAATTRAAQLWECSARQGWISGAGNLDRGSNQGPVEVFSGKESLVTTALHPRNEQHNHRENSAACCPAADATELLRECWYSASFCGVSGHKTLQHSTAHLLLDELSLLGLHRRFIISLHLAALCTIVAGLHEIAH